jgi:hypothetical protein
MKIRFHTIMLFDHANFQQNHAFVVRIRNGVVDCILTRAETRVGASSAKRPRRHESLHLAMKAFVAMPRDSDFGRTS